MARLRVAFHAVVRSEPAFPLTARTGAGVGQPFVSVRRSYTEADIHNASVSASKLAVFTYAFEGAAVRVNPPRSAP